MTGKKKNKLEIIFKKEFLFFLFFNSFFVFTIISSTSSYKPSATISKLISSIIIFLLIFADYVINKPDIKKYIDKINLKKILIFICILFLITGLSIIYSSDRAAGIHKYFTMLVNVISLGIFAFYLLAGLSKGRIKYLYIYLTIITFLSLIFILIRNPFRYNQVAEIGFSDWSHVAYGKFLGLVFIVNLVIITYFKDKLINILSIISLFVISYGLYFTGMRASYIAVMTITFLVFIYYIFKKKKYFAVFALTIFLYQMLLLFLSEGSDTSFSRRFSNLFSYEENFNQDPQINARLMSYSETLEIIKENIFLGKGFGGFKSHSEFTNYIKYPHNIFLEFMVEMGLIGLIFIILFLYYLARYSLNFSYFVFLFLIFSFILSMLSKDIPNQTYLFILMGILIIRKPEEFNSI